MSPAYSNPQKEKTDRERNGKRIEVRQRIGKIEINRPDVGNYSIERTVSPIPRRCSISSAQKGCASVLEGGNREKHPARLYTYIYLTK